MPNFFEIKRGNFTIESDAETFTVQHECGSIPIFFIIYNPDLENRDPRTFLFNQVTISPVLGGNAVQNAATSATQISGQVLMTGEVYTEGSYDQRYSFFPPWPSTNRLHITDMSAVSCTFRKEQYAPKMPIGLALEWLAVYRRV